MSRRLPPLRALRAFEAAARHRSFARAAAELCVTPAAVSQQIKALEDHLGVTLFVRGPHLMLTAAAAAGLPLVTDAFDRLERAAAGLCAGRDAGRLVVSASPAFASRWLIPRLDRLQRRHPDLDVRLSATRRLVDFAAEDVDVAIRYGAGRYPGLHAQRLFANVLVAVASPALAAGLKTPADLLGVPLLRNEGMGWDATHPEWEDWLRDAGLEPAEPILRRFDDAELTIRAAVSGLGVALAWRALVAEEVADGRLVELFPGRELASAFHFVCPPDRLALPKVAAFRAWIVEEAGGGAEG